MSLDLINEEISKHKKRLEQLSTLGPRTWENEYEWVSEEACLDHFLGQRNRILATNHAIERIRMGDESRARLTALQMGITAQSEAATRKATQRAQAIYVSPERRKRDAAAEGSNRPMNGLVEDICEAQHKSVSQTFHDIRADHTVQLSEFFSQRIQWEEKPKRKWLIKKWMLSFIAPMVFGIGARLVFNFTGAEEYLFASIVACSVTLIVAWFHFVHELSNEQDDDLDALRNLIPCLKQIEAEHSVEAKPFEPPVV